MSRSTAWEIASVSPAVRSLAELAASRAGLTLEQWLDQAIVEHASDSEPAASGVALSRGSASAAFRLGEDTRDDPRARPAYPSFHGIGSARDLQERLRATAGPLKLRATSAGAEAALGPAESLPAPPETPFPPAKPDAAPAEAEPQARGGRRRAPEPEAFDLQSALSEIASRRKALDAHLAHEGLDPPPPEPTGEERQDDESSGESTPRASSGPADELRLGLRALSGKLEALRTEWRGARARDRDVDALQDEMATIRRSLSYLAPRASVDATTGPLDDGARVAARLRSDDRGEALLASLDRIAGDLRDALGGYDPSAMAGLDRRIDSLSEKIDALPAAVVREEIVEAVRRQMEEVHDLLFAAAERSLPLERLDNQISRLVDQVERLATKPLVLDSENANALLETLRRQSETAAAPPALASIDARLGDIVRSLANDGLETRSVEASLNAIRAHLEAAEPVPALIRELAAKADAADARERERPQILPILSDIATRLDRLPVTLSNESGAALTSLDQELKGLKASVDRLGSAFPLDDQAAALLAYHLAQKLESLLDSQAPPERLAQIDSRLEAVSDRLGELDALERAARDLLDRLRGRDEDGDEIGAPSSAFAAEISALRQERAAADRRTEALLQGVQDVIDRLVDRLSADDRADRPLGAQNRGGADSRKPAVRIVDPGALAELDDIDPPRPPARRDLPADRAANPPSPLEEDLLLEPGTGAPDRIAAGESHEVSGPRTNPAVTAHIAAARRAAQSAVAANSGDSSASWPTVERNVQHARRFCSEHKRSLLLIAALVVAIAAAARLVSGHTLLAQGPDTDGPSASTAAMETLPHGLPGAAGPPGPGPASIDTAPTGSIGRDHTSVDAGRASGPTPPELSASIPSSLAPALRESVLAGSPAAEYDLAQRLFEGRGAPQDKSAAAFWLQRAASAGYAPAQFRLAALYQKGVGVQQDLAAARRWYAAAAEAGHARAAHNLGVMDAEPADGKADYAEAARWFRSAAQMGVRDSQFNLAVLYARGLGVEQDLRQAWLWFSLAAAQGDAEAGRKRDEVAARMDPAALAAAADLLARFKAVEPDPAANDLAAAQGGGVAPPTRASGPPP